MPSIYCAPPLRKFTDGIMSFEVAGETVGAVLENARRQWPALIDAVTDGRKVNAGVLIFLDGREVRDLGTDGPLAEVARIELVTIAYGG